MVTVARPPVTQGAREQPAMKFARAVQFDVTEQHTGALPWSQMPQVPIVEGFFGDS